MRKLLQKFYPTIEPELLPEIGIILNKPIEEIQARLTCDCEAYRLGTPADCFFLEPASNQCLIHAVKPKPCRSYPSLNDSGAGQVDCPGHGEFKNVVKEFLSHGESAKVRKPTFSKKLKRIP
jgi:Fe-S-cluster containining protein